MENLSFIIKDKDIQNYPDMKLQNGSYKINMFSIHQLNLLIDDTYITCSEISDNKDNNEIFKIKKGKHFKILSLNDTPTLSLKNTILYCVVIIYHITQGKGILFGVDNIKDNDDELISKRFYKTDQTLLFERYGFLYLDFYKYLDNFKDKKIDCELLFKDWNEINKFQTKTSNELVRRVYMKTIIGDRGSIIVNVKNRPLCLE
tara:strand:- start:9154 stop:9762 length:609 start_codon:yes stop_codon:yes gene_type:complete